MACDVSAGMVTSEPTPPRLGPARTGVELPSAFGVFTGAVYFETQDTAPVHLFIAKARWDGLDEGVVDAPNLGVSSQKLGDAQRVVRSAAAPAPPAF